MPNQKISLTGIVQSGTSEEERISDTEVKITEVYGKNARADIVLGEKEVTGTVVIEEEEKKESIYVLSGSKSKSKEFTSTLYEGKITNDKSKYFELFLVDRNKMILNIFEYDEKENRVNPFTILLDDSSKPISNEKIVALSANSNECLSEEDGYKIKGPGFVSFGTRDVAGLKMQTIGYQNNGNNTPHITRLWTKDISSFSSQPLASILKIIVTQARVRKDGVTGSCFNPVNPLTSSQTTFNVQFLVKGVLITIPVRVSSISINPSGYGNPHTVTYYWSQLFARKASTYYVGKDSEGILVEHNFTVNNPSPTAWHKATGTIWYEVVGNYREYFNFTAICEMLYYK